MSLLQRVSCLHMPSHCGDITHDPTSQVCLALDLEVWAGLDNQHSWKFSRWFSGEEDPVDRENILIQLRAVISPLFIKYFILTSP